MKKMKMQRSRSKDVRGIKAKRILVLSAALIILMTSVAFAANDPIDNATEYISARLTTIFVVIVLFYIVKNLAKNATTKLIGFLIIAAIGAIFVYKPQIFGELADWLYNILL